MIYDCDLHTFQYKMKLIIINNIFILHTLHMYSMLYLYILRLTMFVMLCKIIFFISAGDETELAAAHQAADERLHGLFPLRAPTRPDRAARRGQHGVVAGAGPPLEQPVGGGAGAVRGGGGAAEGPAQQGVPGIQVQAGQEATARRPPEPEPEDVVGGRRLVSRFIDVGGVCSDTAAEGGGRGLHVAVQYLAGPARRPQVDQPQPAAPSVHHQQKVFVQVVKTVGRRLCRT